MYGLPPGQDFTFFVGQVLLQVCFGRHEMILNFDTDTSITVEGNMGIEDTDGRERVISDLRQAAEDVVSLVEQSVTNAEPQPNGTLSLTFGGGRLLNIYDSSTHYESYQVRHGSDLIVV